METYTDYIESIKDLRTVKCQECGDMFEPYEIIEHNGFLACSECDERLAFEDERETYVSMKRQGLI